MTSRRHLEILVDIGDAAPGLADEGFARHRLEGGDEARVRHLVGADLALDHVEACCCKVRHLGKRPCIAAARALLRPGGRSGLGLYAPQGAKTTRQSRQPRSLTAAGAGSIASPRHRTAQSGGAYPADFKSLPATERKRIE